MFALSYIELYESKFEKCTALAFFLEIRLEKQPVRHSDSQLQDCQRMFHMIKSRILEADTGKEAGSTQ